MYSNIKHIKEMFNIDLLDMEDDGVYKVINITNAVKIQELETELGNCVLIVSRKDNIIKLDSGISVTIAPVYYIILNNNPDLILKYYKQSLIEYSDSIIDSYNGEFDDAKKIVSTVF